MRKLDDLHMKDTDSVASHLNEFDALWSQLQAQKMTMDDELEFVFFVMHVAYLMGHFLYCN